MIVAFRFQLAPTEIHSKVDVYVLPAWGFYAFLLATMISLILTHIILAAHRKIIKAEKHIGETLVLSSSPQSKKRKSLCSIAFTPGLRQIIGSLLITFGLIISLCLLIVGSYWISFEFQFRGAAAIALSYLSQSVSQAYSLITLGLGLPSASPEPNSFGIRFIQVTFFLYGLAIPLFHLFFLLILWLLPLSRKSQRRIYILTEILNAWSAIDVFVISVIAALLEISQFAQFIIGNRCDQINYYLALYLNDVLKGVDKCFDVITKLDTGCWLLFAGCVSYVVSSFFVMRACHRALSNREKEDKILTEKEPDEIEPEPEDEKEENQIDPEPEPQTPSIQ